MKSRSLRISLLRPATRVLGLVPLPWLHAAAVPMAWLLGLLPWNKHGVIRRNLTVCFPELTAERRKRLAQAHRVELLRLASELGAVAQWREERLARHLTTIDGWEHVQAAISTGRSVLFVTGHLGNWEILNLELSRRTDLVTLYRAPDDPSLDRFISAARTRLGGRVVASGSSAMRQMLRQLRAGGAVAIAADIQPKHGDGVFVPFFNVPALTMTLVHRLALRTGCAVIFCHALRLPAGRGWSLHFQPAPPDIHEPDPARALQSMNDWLSDKIRTEPAQYLWIYKRFSRRPGSSEPRFYPKT
jgi:KDO2-lipid IV(A) lauroyltransferase